MVIRGENHHVMSWFHLRKSFRGWRRQRPKKFPPWPRAPVGLPGLVGMMGHTSSCTPAVVTRCPIIKVGENPNFSFKFLSSSAQVSYPVLLILYASLSQVPTVPWIGNYWPARNQIPTMNGSKCRGWKTTVVMFAWLVAWILGWLVS